MKTADTGPTANAQRQRLFDLLRLEGLASPTMSGTSSQTDREADQTHQALPQSKSADQRSALPPGSDDMPPEFREFLSHRTTLQSANALLASYKSKDEFLFR